MRFVTPRALRALLAALVLLACSTALAIDPPVLLWQRGGCAASFCDFGWYASPAVADVNRDGVADVLAASYSLVSLDGRTGAQQWKVTGTSRIWPGVVVADIDNDGSLEIVTGNGQGRLAAYNGAGGLEPNWPVQVTASELRSLAVADLDRDGRLDMVASAAIASAINTWVYSDTATLRPGWPQLVGTSGYAFGTYNTNGTVGDLDGNGTQAIVVPSDVHYACAYAPDGTQRAAGATTWGKVGFWRDPAVEARGFGSCDGTPSESQRAYGTFSPAAIADVDGDGTKEVVVTGNMTDCSDFTSKFTTAFIVNGNRSRFVKAPYDWSTPPVDTGAPLSEDTNVIESATPNPVVADLDLDGRQEVLFPSYDGKLHAFWLDRTEHGGWPFSAQRPGDAYISFAGEPAVADLDGDGAAEVIVATWPAKASGARGRLFILSAAGAVLRQVDLPAPFGSTTWNGALAAPTLGDVNGDGNLDVVLQTVSSGVVAYSLPNTPHARPIWATGRWGPRRAGSCAEARPAAVGTLTVKRSGTADIELGWSAAPGAVRYDARRALAAAMTGATPVGHTAGTTLLDPGAQSDGRPIVFYQVVPSNGCGLATP